MLSNNPYLVDLVDLGIIDAVARWKVITMKDLLDQVSSLNICYSTVTRRVRKLQKMKYLDYKSLSKRRKHLFLTREGTKLTNVDTPYEMNTLTLNHDILVGAVVRAFLELPGFVFGSMYDETYCRSFTPDGVLHSSTKKRVAIELELTQKECSRVKSKFAQYWDDPDFDYCYYVTNKPSLYKSYKNYLEEMDEEVQERIVIILAYDLRCDHIFENDAMAFYMGEELHFEEAVAKTLQFECNILSKTFAPAENPK